MRVNAVRIVWRITRLNFRAQLEYRTEFLLMIAIGAIWQVSVIVFATVLLTRFAGMGGWDSSDVLLIPATRMMAHGLMVLFLGRMHGIGRYIQEGRIDIYLVRPMPVHRQAQLEYFPTNAIGDLTVATGLMIGALGRSHLDWTAGRTAYLIAALIGGMLLEAALFTAVAGASSASRPRTTGAAGWRTSSAPSAATRSTSCPGRSAASSPTPFRSRSSPTSRPPC